MRFMPTQAVEAVRWWKDGNSPDVRASDGSMYTCRDCDRSFKVHGVLHGIGVCPGDWVVTDPEGGVDVWRHERFTQAFTPLRWAVRTWDGRREFADAVQWNTHGDLDTVRPCGPWEWRDNPCDGCDASRDAHGVVERDVAWGLVCPGDWFVTGCGEADGLYTDEGFRENFKEVVDVDAWERESGTEDGS